MFILLTWDVYLHFMSSKQNRNTQFDIIFTKQSNLVIRQHVVKHVM